MPISAILKKITKNDLLCKNHKLYLINLNLTNIKYIKNLTKLKYLELSSSISDLRYLSELTKVEELDLSSNKITDIEPITKLLNLASLKLLRCDINKTLLQELTDKLGDQVNMYM